MEEEPTKSEKFKNQGNVFFRQKKYNDAIKMYTKAIEINNNQSTYFSNRARCYQILQNFQQAYKDAVEAVELDDKNIKAHQLVGESLAEIGKFD